MKNVVEVYRSGDRLLSIKMVIEEEIVNVNREWWAVKKQQEHKMDVTEMKMLRGMSGYTLKDRIRNDHIRERVEVAPISEKNERILFKVVWTYSKKRIRWASKNSGADDKGALYKK